MNINPTIYNAYKVGATTQKRMEGQRVDLSFEERLDAVGGEKIDRLSLSQEATSQREAGKVVRTVMQDIREYDSLGGPRVEKLRQEVQSGMYQVSSQDLADAILGRAFGK